ALQVYVQMRSCGCDAELRNERQLVLKLAKEIDYKNDKLLDLELKHDELTANFQKRVSDFTEAIDSKERSLSEMKQKYYESTVTIRMLITEKDALREEYSREMRKMQSINKKLENDLESQKKEIQQQAKELEESKTQNDLVQRALKDEIEKLKVKLQDRAPVISSCDVINTQIDALMREIEEKAEEMQDLENLNHVLVVKECKSNQELQEARKELVDGLQDLLDNQTLIIKRMGEIDRRPFQDMCLQTFSGGDWQGLAAEMCSLWQEQIKNPLWHPFMIKDVNGTKQ
ncbi:hypothetical protein UlMin_024109, partial [Ulmus minor]